MVVKSRESVRVQRLIDGEMSFRESLALHTSVSAVIFIGLILIVAVPDGPAGTGREWDLAIRFATSVGRSVLDGADWIIPLGIGSAAGLYYGEKSSAIRDRVMRFQLSAFGSVIAIFLLGCLWHVVLLAVRVPHHRASVVVIAPILIIGIVMNTQLAQTIRQIAPVRIERHANRLLSEATERYRAICSRASCVALPNSRAAAVLLAKSVGIYIVLGAAALLAVRTVAVGSISVGVVLECLAVVAVVVGLSLCARIYRLAWGGGWANTAFLLGLLAGVGLIWVGVWMAQPDGRTGICLLILALTAAAPWLPPRPSVFSLGTGVHAVAARLVNVDRAKAGIRRRAARIAQNLSY